MFHKMTAKRKFAPLWKFLRYFVFCAVFVILIHIYTLSFHPDYHEHVMKQMRPIILRINDTIHQRRGDEIEPQYRRYIEELGLHNPGENGSAVVIPSNASEEIKQMVKEGYDRHGYNDFVSNMIRIDREVFDYRSDICKQRTYSANLPKASIIIPFHNEAWTLLMRTVHSVLNRSPSELIEEIVLVDDVSDHEELLQHLDDYILNFPKLKVIRSPTRQGVIKARLLGAVNAKGPILLFLDSHVEVMHGWLEPMLDRFTYSDSVVVTNYEVALNISTLKYDTWDLKEPIHIPGFAWNLDFIGVSLKHFSGDTPIWDPKPSPVVYGSNHAIRKDFFMHIGMLDPEFDVWGGEDVELSFRTWLCGGKVEFTPCSMLAHMYKIHKYSVSCP